MLILRMAAVTSVLFVCACSSQQVTLNGPFMVENDKGIFRDEFSILSGSEKSYIYFDRERKIIFGIGRDLRIDLPKKSEVRFKKDKYTEYKPRDCLYSMEKCIRDIKCEAKFEKSELESLNNSVFSMKNRGFPISGISYVGNGRKYEVTIYYYLDCKYMLEDINKNLSPESEVNVRFEDRG